MTTTTNDLESLFQRAFEEPATLTNEDVSTIMRTVEPDSEWNTIDAIVSVVDDDPERIDVVIEHLEAGLRDADERQRETAAVTVSQLAMRYSKRLEPLVPALIDCLDDSLVARNQAVQALARISSEAPEAVVPAVDHLSSFLDDVVLVVRLSATEIAYAVAKTAPEQVKPLVSDLVAVVIDDNPDEELDTNAHSANLQMRRRERKRQKGAQQQRQTARMRAAQTLSELGRAHPKALEAAVPKLLDHLGDESNPAVRNAIIEVVATLVEADSVTVSGAADPLIDVLETADEETAASASLVLVHLAEADEEVVENVRSAAPVLIEMLDGDTPRVRGAAASVLLLVGERYPADLEPATPKLRSLLDDETAFVRGSAVWALASVGDVEDRRRLRDLAESDPEPEVREAATAAVEEIDGRLDH